MGILPVVEMFELCSGPENIWDFSNSMFCGVSETWEITFVPPHQHVVYVFSVKHWKCMDSELGNCFQ